MSQLHHTLIAALLSWAVAGAAHSEEPQFIVAGYVPDYQMANWSKDVESLTDLIYFGMSVPDDGQFVPGAISEKDVAALQAIKSKSKCRLLFAVGGWEKSGGFPALANDSQVRSKFIRDARDFCIRNGFNGIDYDWEHPSGADQIKSFTALLKETHTEFAEHQLIVTVAQAGWQNLGREAYRVVDRIHLMSYDHDFPQATFEKSKADVERLVEAGCPTSKIVLGLPFYGRDKERNSKTYAELRNGATLADNVDIVDGFAFNGVAMIERKVRYARQRRLGGVMIWEIGQDVSGRNSLLRTIGKAVRP